MGRVAAVLLAEGPDRHAGKRYRPTGPQLLNGREMAAIVAKAVGHGVMPDPHADLDARQGRAPAGHRSLSDLLLRYYMEDMKRGTFAFEGGVTDVVEELTGTPAESFETTARRYAALPFARQTLANRLKAFVNFNLTPFYPGYNFDKWDRQMRLPTPAERQPVDRRCAMARRTRRANGRRLERFALRLSGGGVSRRRSPAVARLHAH